MVKCGFCRKLIGKTVRHGLDKDTGIHYHLNCIPKAEAKENPESRWGEEETITGKEIVRKEFGETPKVIKWDENPDEKAKREITPGFWWVKGWKGEPTIVEVFPTWKGHQDVSKIGDERTFYAEGFKFLKPVPPYDDKEENPKPRICDLCGTTPALEGSDVCVECSQEEKATPPYPDENPAKRDIHKELASHGLVCFFDTLGHKKGYTIYERNYTEVDYAQSPAFKTVAEVRRYWKKNKKNILQKITRANPENENLDDLDYMIEGL